MANLPRKGGSEEVVLYRLPIISNDNEDDDNKKNDNIIAIKRDLQITCIKVPIPRVDQVQNITVIITKPYSLLLLLVYSLFFNYNNNNYDYYYFLFLICICHLDLLSCRGYTQKKPVATDRSKESNGKGR